MAELLERCELFERHPDNPILSPADWPYPVAAVFNPAAATLPDGTTCLLCRVEDRRGVSHLTVARSANGIDGWEIDPAPTLAPDPERREEEFGLEDPRVVYVPELGRFAVLYTAYSAAGPTLALALTEDFRHFERRGGLLAPPNKNGALLPRRFGDRWALLHRAMPGDEGNVWIASSVDLEDWGGHRQVMSRRRGPWWDSTKIGIGPPPLETPEGWLLIYHGVRMVAGGPQYRLGLAPLDLEQPDRCLRRGREWIFAPEASYERMGDVGNVVFACGATVGPDGDTLRLYYGAADTYVAVATASVRRLLEWLRANGDAG